MGAPGIPQNLYLVQGNGNVALAWDLSAGATGYSIQRSTDAQTYAVVATVTSPSYLDTSTAVGTLYYYQVASSNGSGSSPYCVPQTVIPAGAGAMSLAQVRLSAQQEADRVGSNFVSSSEWALYINQSYFELYDLLVTLYEDYFLAPAFSIVTNGQQFYNLPDGLTVTDSVTGLVAAPYYKMLGVDCGLGNSTNAWSSLKKFDFSSRNRYVFPNVQSTYLGVFNLQYRVMGNQIQFIPTPSSGQTVRLWYIPRLKQLCQDTDIMDGISGWTEYVIVDAVIKALMKEEGDVSGLMLRKEALLKRIEDSAMNRDAGQPDTISDTRGAGGWGWGGAGFDGPCGGW